MTVRWHVVDHASVIRCSVTAPDRASALRQVALRGHETLVSDASYRLGLSAAVRRALAGVGPLCARCAIHPAADGSAECARCRARTAASRRQRQARPVCRVITGAHREAIRQSNVQRGIARRAAKRAGVA